MIDKNERLPEIDWDRIFSNKKEIRKIQGSIPNFV